MGRGSYFARKLKSGIFAAARISGMAAPAYAADPPKLALIGVCLAHHRLFVPWRFPNKQ